jgi:hypothetical protein
VIEDDYRKVKRDLKQKMSELTLKYLKEKRVLTHEQYFLYRPAAEKPEDRITITEKNIIAHINLKLINFYENI